MRRESNPPATNTRNTRKCETVPFVKAEFDRHLPMESQANVEPLSLREIEKAIDQLGLDIPRLMYT